MIFTFFFAVSIIAMAGVVVLFINAIDLRNEIDFLKLENQRLHKLQEMMFQQIGDGK